MLKLEKMLERIYKLNCRLSWFAQTQKQSLLMSIIDLGQSLKSVNEKAVFNNNLNKVLKKKLK